MNIADDFLVDRLREGRGGRVAVICGQERLTYAEVDTRAGRYAAAMQHAGVQREQRVFVALPDGPDFVAALFGTLKLGAVVVMVNPELPSTRVEELVELCSPAVAVAGEAAATYDAAGVRVITPDEATASEPLTADAVACAPADPALWLFSGGTTGVPKAVVQSHNSFLNTTRLYAHETLGYRESDATLSIPKLYFGYATGSNLFFPFSVGGRTVLFPERPTAEIVFELIAEHRPTIFITVPTMVSRMLAHPGARDQDLSSLRFATSAGEALPEELYRAWVDTYGIELLDGLGTAEMWHVFVTNRLGDVKPGTLGKAVAGFEVKVADDEGNPVPDGVIGKLWVRGDSLAAGYWQDPDRTAAAFQGDWFVGGDLARRDEEGYIEHHGRADDALKVGGKWLAPQEVESCLLEHERVDTAVVVGAANEEGLIKPVAFVIPTEPSEGLEDELMEWTLERLEPYKHPRRVILTDDLPKTHLGKVDRTSLKRLAESA